MAKVSMKDEPHVEIFGDSMGRHHHRDSGSVVWGVMLLLGGCMLLLNTMNAVPWQVWDYIGHFWPILFIFMGLQVIFGNTILASIILFVTSVIAFGLIFVASLQWIGSPIVAHMNLSPEVSAVLDFIRRIRI